MPTNPTDRFSPLFSGIELGAYSENHGGSTGTLGCFINTDGIPDVIPAGTYLLSCHHVLFTAHPAANQQYQIYQPSVYFREGNVITEDLIGDTKYGVIDDSNDCAIVQLNASREYVNEVPAAPLHPGRNRISSMGEGKIGDRVYKFGAFSKYTTGTITAVNGNSYTISSQNGWAGGGDSGSLLIRQSDNTVLGLNYSVSDDYVNGTGMAKTGYAYTIQSQVANFGSHVTLV